MCRLLGESVETGRHTCKWKCKSLHRLCLVFEIGSSGWRVCDEWVRCFSLPLVIPAQMLFSWSRVDKEALQTRSALALLRRSADESLAVAPGLSWHYGDVIPVSHSLINTTHPFCLSFAWFMFCFISNRWSAATHCITVQLLISCIAAKYTSY